MGRKTFDVDTFRTTINQALADSTCEPAQRQGLMNALENVLHASGNYKGFSYLMREQVPKGELPGINVNGTGLIESTPYEQRFDPALTDKTRVKYF